MSVRNSSSDDLRKRIRASALLAAYGDALGFITELTDRKGLLRRAGVDHLAETVPWRRRIGGQFGPTIELPAGTISDDTQLRLATSRSIATSGAFDVETFAEIELTVWPAYALGAGRGSLAAAASLRKRDVTWASNFFEAKGANYLNGGGNGAAMRIQPHVWSTSPTAPEWSWLPDVLANAVCTHGHARGFAGAAFHAACVEFALRTGTLPGPREWFDFIDGLGRIGDVVHTDDRLNEIWRVQWERRSGTSVGEAVREVSEELRADVELCAGLEQGRAGGYHSAVEHLRAFEPSQRGSGTKTALLGAVAAWLFPNEPLIPIAICADAIGTDTDSIATMAGAIAGAAAPTRPHGELVDRGYIAREADRMWAAALGHRPPRFPYPDLMEWKAPKSATDAVFEGDGEIFVSGLGPGRFESPVFEASGSATAGWQWLSLWFGQTILVKRRPELQTLHRRHYVEPSAVYADSDVMAGSTAGAQKRPNAEEKRPSPPEPAGRRLAQRRLVEKGREGRTVDAITDSVIAAGLSDEAIGAGLREVSVGPAAVENSVAYAAIIAKALRSRAKKPAG